ncbi:MAG: hypothetical protein ACI4VS_03690, partial [Candidatus Nanosyncoccaceae bacterium]
PCTRPVRTVLWEVGWLNNSQPPTRFVSYEAINGKRTERQKIEELNRYSFREASQALSSLGSSLAEYMAGHITLTKTKDGYVTYDELLAELRKMFGVRK